MAFEESFLGSSGNRCRVLFSGIGQDEAAVGTYDLASFSVSDQAGAATVRADIVSDLVPGSGLPPAHHRPPRGISGLRRPVWAKLVILFR